MNSSRTIVFSMMISGLVIPRKPSFLTLSSICSQQHISLLSKVFSTLTALIRLISHTVASKEYWVCAVQWYSFLFPYIPRYLPGISNRSSVPYNSSTPLELRLSWKTMLHRVLLPHSTNKLAKRRPAKIPFLTRIGEVLHKDLLVWQSVTLTLNLLTFSSKQNSLPMSWIQMLMARTWKTPRTNILEFVSNHIIFRVY